MMNLKLRREHKDVLIVKLQEYYQTERSEEIGSIAAEGFIEFMIRELGPYIYNQAINDARTLINEKMLSIEDDLYALEKPINLRKR
ncbi:hypothetical protein BHF71_06040 [Vulcanibacillus modesticaldus]|uniref:DUF2164 domain-containing protein n=1 Tax=Vulcanibacillus modesticaldus TaxID=337097 RepID=A0A1D2YWY4_9BACI|nr:DUF2164 domain-containing protein [Vulcanibacillus modesticaldus]OEG00182.1 hypothetical protein BHF71_06040 [Vulcanibacillus modesticaldus]